MTSRWIRTLALVAGVPLALLAASVVLVLSWRSDLPDPMASHWGTSGVDEVAPLSQVVLTLVVLDLVCIALFTAIARWARDDDGAVPRHIAGVALWVGSFLPLTLASTTAVQRGNESAYDAGSPLGPLVFALLVATLIAVVGALVAPGEVLRTTRDPIPGESPRLELGRGESAVWTRSAVSKVGLLAGLGPVVVGVVLFVVTGLWPLLVVLVAVGLLVVALMAWRVTVDRRGLTVRAVFGYPRMRVGLDEVESADVATVAFGKDFGGWGIRVGRDGRTGIILRYGDALEVRRVGGRPLVVTVDDAVTGAALLNTLAARQHG